ncbi:tetratricopeptide repeat protein 24 isoform X2 [Fundulus heteroclitus]|uniref:tetratricopeptide repeat protein 24 isoform X2 n=1 Tax=Fundulus heteroclitus TaxID=8078 RepID=UPI00165ADC6A|nr:tetratricopeptide repeat protein 24 isoform X2 [Fundulus heteroclitus]
MSWQQVSCTLSGRLHPGEFTCCRFNMASDESPPEEKKVKRRSSRKLQKKTAHIEDLTSAGHTALQEGRPQDALSCFEQALKIAAQLQDSRVLRACCFNLGAAYVEAGRPHKGLDFLRRARSGPKAERLPDLQFNMALAHNALGQSQEATACFLQAAQLYRSQGDGGSEGDACMEMGHCYSRIQDWSLAVQSFLRAAESYKVASMLDSAAAALKEAGSHMVHSDQFSHDDVKDRLTECLRLSNSVGDPSTLGELYLSVGVSYCRIRCFQEAVTCFQPALELAAQRPPLLAKLLQNLGAALNSLGKFSSAVDYHRLAAGLYGSLGCRADQARCFNNLAMACSQLGDDQEAAESFILALQGFRDTEDHLAEVQVCELLAECYLRQKKLQKAVQLYKQAVSTLSYCKEAEGVQDRLVEHLSAALQQSLAVTQRPHPDRTCLYLPHPHSSPGGQDVRKSGTAPSLAANQQSGGQRLEAPDAGRKGEASSGGQSAAEPTRSSEGGVSDGASLTPGFQRSVPSEKLHQGEQWLDRENPHPDSEASSPQQVESSPTSSGDVRKAASPVSSWKSRLCSLM